jgi:hypothetical protein
MIAMTKRIAALKANALPLFALILMGSVMVSPAKAQELNELFNKLLNGSQTEDHSIKDKAPLVVPPSNVLPKPKTVNLEEDKAWPQDPDVLKKKKKAKGGDDLEPGELIQKLLGQDNQQPIEPSPPTPSMGSRHPDTVPLSAEEIARQNAILKQIAEQNRMTQSGTRGGLTQPPVEIRKKAVITPEIEAAAQKAGEGKPWYQFW